MQLYYQNSNSQSSTADGASPFRDSWLGLSYNTWENKCSGEDSQIYSHHFAVNTYMQRQPDTPPSAAVQRQVPRRVPGTWFIAYHDRGTMVAGAGVSLRIPLESLISSIVYWSRLNIPQINNENVSQEYNRTSCPDKGLTAC